MTILSGFRATGVYPFNRQAISIPGVEKDTATPTAKVARRQGIKYMPFYSPRPSRQVPPSQHHAQPQFSEEELRCFEKWFKEKFDLPHPRYKLWLQQQHSAVNGPSLPFPSTLDLDCTSLSPDLTPPSSPTSSSDPKPSGKEHEPLWSEFLTVPNPAYKARIPTSESFSCQLAEKEQKEEAAEKEQ